MLAAFLTGPYLAFLQRAKIPPFSPSNRDLLGKPGICPFFWSCSGEKIVKKGV